MIKHLADLRWPQKLSRRLFPSGAGGARSGLRQRSRHLCARHAGSGQSVCGPGGHRSGLFRHIGNLDCDVFVDGERLWVLELNPRFGGGSPFTYHAGVNLPAALIAWAQGEAVAPRWLSVQPDIAIAKCDRLVGIVNL